MALVAFLKQYGDMFVQAAQQSPRVLALAFLIGAWVFVYVTLTIAVQALHSSPHLFIHIHEQLQYQAPHIPALQLIRSSLLLGACSWRNACIVTVQVRW